VFAAIDSLLDPATQTTIRAEAARLSESFSAKGTAEWIWDSLEQGSPKTNVYDALMPETT
jgi:hypothetical protein